jgi:hypothetical protein
MLLGKVIKLAKRHLPEDNQWLQSLRLAYDKAKVELYFKVPVLPKRLYAGTGTVSEAKLELL